MNRNHFSGDRDAGAERQVNSHPAVAAPDDRKTRLEAARRRVDELIKEEPGRIRLAKLKKARNAVKARRGFCS